MIEIINREEKPYSFLARFQQSKYFLGLFWVAVALSIPAYKIFNAISESSWTMLMLTGLGSIFVGLLVSCVVFGGQISNKFASHQTLDSICKWGILLFYLFLMVLLFCYYLALFVQSQIQIGALIWVYIFSGMLIGLYFVRTQNRKKKKYPEAIF